MFNKLSFEELANLYGALDNLEKHYGKERVRDGLEAMANILDRAKNPLINVKSEQPEDQLEFELEQQPVANIPKGGEKKRNFANRRRKGENEKAVRNYFGDKDPEVEILKLYYKHGLTQKQIGDAIGVKQRTISQILQDIPEKRKRKIMSEWGMES